MFGQSGGNHDKQENDGDLYSRNWLVTPLGQFVAMIVIVVVGLFLVYAIRPSVQRTTSKPNVAVVNTDIQRTFDEADAVDFVQETYDGYLKSIDITRLAARKAAKTDVYERNTMLLRLESLRAQIDAVLYTKVRIVYIDAVRSDDHAIKRDELLCSPYNFTAINAVLKQKNGDQITVSVTRKNDQTPAGGFDAVVDAKERKIVDITCN